MHGEASLAALKNTKFLYLCICYRQGLKSGAILTNCLIYRPFLLVFFTLYQRDKHLKKAMVPVPFSIPVSCTINRLLPMLSCSNMRRLSQQVCCIHIELVLCPWGSLCVRQLHLTEGFIMLPAPLEVKFAHMIAHYFNSSCKGQEFKQKSQCAVKLLFCTFIALLIILQSLPYLQFLPTVNWLDFDLYLFPLTKMLGKALRFRDATASSCSLSCCLAAVGISPAPHEHPEKCNTSHKLPVNTCVEALAKHIAPCSCTKGLSDIRCIFVVLEHHQNFS